MRVLRLVCALVLLLAGAAAALAAGTVSVRFASNSSQVRVGQATTIIITVSNARVSAGVKLPQVPGLVVNGTGVNPGKDVVAYTFIVTPTRAGAITIPTFDIHADNGEVLRVDPITVLAF
jgi:uncharacterized protein (DUF58 family)